MLIELQKSNVRITQRGSLGGGGGFTYSWQNPTYNVFNDGGQSNSNFLTTNNPADPLTYLVFDTAYITNVVTQDLGGGFWEIDFDTVVNAGGVGSIQTLISAHGNTFAVNFPGQVYTIGTFNVGAIGQTYLKNGSPVTLPFTLSPGDALDIDCPAAVSGANSGAIQVTDNRMLAPTASLMSGNGTLSPNAFSAPSGHSCTFNIGGLENAPFGGTIIQIVINGLGVTLNYHIGL